MARPKKPIKAKKTVPAKGAPYDFDEVLLNAIISLSEKGLTDKEIAHEIGIGYSTLKMWKVQKEGFKDAITKARSLADSLVEQALFKRAVGYTTETTKCFMHEGCIVSEVVMEHYPPDTKAAEIWLRNRKPDTWREKKEVEVSGSLKLEDLIQNSFKEKDEE